MGLGRFVFQRSGCAFPRVYQPPENGFSTKIRQLAVMTSTRISLSAL